jgi:hypothetical protein
MHHANSLFSSDSRILCHILEMYHSYSVCLFAEYMLHFVVPRGQQVFNQASASGGRHDMWPQQGTLKFEIKIQISVNCFLSVLY